MIEKFLIELLGEKICKWNWIDGKRFIDLQDLKDYMRQAGEVTYADAHKQHRNEG